MEAVSWLLLAGLTSALAADEPSYFLVGGKLVLRPPPPDVITSILWKHEGDLLAEWSSDDGFEFYGSFRGRTALDQKSGQLEVSNMSRADLGVYAVEINRMVQDQRYVATAITEVPQPYIWVTPVACSAAKDWCLLICEGHTEEAEPVTYSWRTADEEWRPARKDMNISKNEIAQVEWFSCRMKNPVSEKHSEPKHNPFFQARESAGPGVSRPWRTLGVLLLLLFLICAAIAFSKRDTIKSRFCHSNGNTNADSTARAQPSTELSDKQSEAMPLNEDPPLQEVMPLMEA